MQPLLLQDAYKMSQSLSLTKIIYDPSRLRTPNEKETASSSSQIEDVPYNPPILMDEYGQTPDHFYLARKPPTYFQVYTPLRTQKFYQFNQIFLFSIFLWNWYLLHPLISPLRMLVFENNLTLKEVNFNFNKIVWRLSYSNFSSVAFLGQFSKFISKIDIL